MQSAANWRILQDCAVAGSLSRSPRRLRLRPLRRSCCYTSVLALQARASGRHERPRGGEYRDQILLSQSSRSRDLGHSRGVWIFVLATRNFGLQGLLSGAVGLFALQAFWSFVLGVRVLEDRVTLPRQLFNPLPLLVFARKSVSLKLLSDLTSAGRFLGFDVVMLTLPEAAIPVLFSTRSARLAFFEAIKRRVPDMRITAPTEGHALEPLARSFQAGMETFITGVWFDY